MGFLLRWCQKNCFLYSRIKTNQKWKLFSSSFINWVSSESIWNTWWLFLKHFKQIIPKQWSLLCRSIPVLMLKPYPQLTCFHKLTRKWEMKTLSVSWVSWKREKRDCITWADRGLRAEKERAGGREASGPHRVFVLIWRGASTSCQVILARERSSLIQEKPCWF